MNQLSNTVRAGASVGQSTPQQSGLLVQQILLGLIVGLLPVLGLLIWLFIFVISDNRPIYWDLFPLLPWFFWSCLGITLLVALIHFLINRRRAFALSTLPTLVFSFVLFLIFFWTANGFLSILNSATQSSEHGPISAHVQQGQTASDYDSHAAITYLTARKVVQSGSIYIVVHVKIQNTSLFNPIGFFPDNFIADNSVKDANSSELASGSGDEIHNYQGQTFFDTVDSPQLAVGQTFEGDLIFSFVDSQLMPNEFIWQPQPGTQYIWTLNV